MASKLNRRTYEDSIIAGDLEWLLRQPRTLERDHIEVVLRASPAHEYREVETRVSTSDPPTIFGSVALILDSRKRALCVTNNGQTRPGFSLPGGKATPLERGLEMWKNTCTREVLEETGLQIGLGALSLVAKGRGSAEPKAFVRVFHVTKALGTPLALEPGTDCRWMQYRELCDDTVFGAFYEEHFPDGWHHLCSTQMPDLTNPGVST